jgi:hypothetical protein
MHQGTSTMCGRMMAGSHAGIAHNEAGDAGVGASHPPAIQVSRSIVASGQQVVEATGSPLVVIDRAVHALALAAAFAEQDWGLWCMRDANAPPGRESGAARPAGPLHDGSQV